MGVGGDRGHELAFETAPAPRADAVNVLMVLDLVSYSA